MQLLYSIVDTDNETDQSNMLEGQAPLQPMEGEEMEREEMEREEMVDGRPQIGMENESGESRNLSGTRD